jgi:hypothetical protein
MRALWLSMSKVCANSKRADGQMREEAQKGAEIVLDATCSTKR